MTSPITQVAEHTIHNNLIQDDYILEKNLSRTVKLNLRGERVKVDIETLRLFPDSFILCMFPAGLDPRNSTLFSTVHSIDLDPQCFHYLHSFYQHISLDHRSPLFGNDPLLSALLAGTKQLIIVLREELDYFILPQSSDHDITRDQLKTRAGQYLVGENKVFEALIRNIDKENNRAEQHLITLLCQAGLNMEDQWAYRALDPRRTCITSLTLCSLADQRDIIPRFMLFWKKPARKCWWEAELLNLDTTSIRLWKRRTFWLELSTA